MHFPMYGWNPGDRQSSFVQRNPAKGDGGSFESDSILSVGKQRAESDAGLDQRKVKRQKVKKQKIKK